MEAVLLGPLGRTPLGSGELTIGCDPDNQLVVTGIRTAAHHALIRLDSSGYAILDLESAYGTRVNGQWLDPKIARPLQSGDVIQIGDTSFTYELYQSAASIPTGTLGVGIGNAPVPAPSSSYGGYGTGGGYAGSQPAPTPARMPLLTQPRPQQLPYTSQPWISDGMTSYPTQQQLWQQDRRRLYISLGMMLAAIIIVSLLSVAFYRSTPDRTLDTFCNALLNGNGQLAYNQLSSKLQSQQGALFVEEFSAIKATVCTHTPAIISGSSARATLTTRFPANSGSLSGSVSTTSVTLIQDANGVWKMDTLQSQ
ncbi:MAG TPA: FHA domain-containing protein [Ktedonobacteraceae bacterium]|nr:FHA domain-containing protein [Ktedonobacteraceae bacterium]